MAWFDQLSVSRQLTTAQLALFNNEIRTQQIRSTRFFTIVTLLLSLVFLASDAHFLQQHFDELAWLRISVVLACVTGALTLEYLTLRGAYFLLAGALIIYNTVIVYIGILAANAGLDTYQQGTVIIIIYCCTLFQAPLLLTTAITTICWASYVIGISLYSTTDVSVILNNTIVFLIASILGLLTVSHRERYLLNYFLTTQKLKEQERNSKEQAFKDALTKLPNRLSIMQKIESYEALIPKDMIVMMADVDNFKKINDRFGHKSGDLALKLIADTLNQHIQNKNGFVSRYGGEEFMIILENYNEEESKALGNALVASINNISHPELPAMSISIGGYLTTGNETSMTDCIERADQTLLRAKKDGKNRFLLNQRVYSR
jgi:diguanylate cyclase (GGDEF)-like protein